MEKFYAKCVSWGSGAIGAISGEAVLARVEIERTGRRVRLTRYARGVEGGGEQISEVAGAAGNWSVGTQGTGQDRECVPGRRHDRETYPSSHTARRGVKS